MGFDVTDLFDKISQLLIDNSERDDYMLLTTVFDLLTCLLYTSCIILIIVIY